MGQDEQVASVTRPPIRFVLNLEWFRQRLLLLHDYTPRNLKLTFDR
jgi:hypothetical protein